MFALLYGNVICAVVLSWHPPTPLPRSDCWLIAPAPDKLLRGLAFELVNVEERLKGWNIRCYTSSDVFCAPEYNEIKCAAKKDLIWAEWKETKAAFERKTFSVYFWKDTKDQPSQWCRNLFVKSKVHLLKPLQWFWSETFSQLQTISASICFI